MSRHRVSTGSARGIVAFVVVATTVAAAGTFGGTTAVSAAPPVRPAAVISGLTESVVGSVATPVSVTALPDGRAVVL